MTNSLQARARDLVHREVNCCLSSLVSTMAQSVYAISANRDLSDLLEQAFELASPIADYEEAAIQAGWAQVATIGDRCLAFQHYDGRDLSGTWQEVCEAEGIERYDREVFEHWSVSQWFGEKLAAHGEKVDFDFAGLVVWARTTTGQAIYCDYVVEQIAKELHNG